MRRNVKEQIKILLADRDVKMKDLVLELAQKVGSSTSLSNFSCKLKRGTLTYNEVLDICDILDYDIEFKSRLWFFVNIFTFVWHALVFVV